MAAGEWPPNVRPLVINGCSVAPYVVADAGFPDIGGRIVKPYPGGMLQDGNPFQRNFNFAQSSTRMPVEHVNGMLKRRWRIMYLGCELWSLSTMVDVIMTCCILHNMCVLDNDAPADEMWGDEQAADAGRRGNDVNDNAAAPSGATEGMYNVMLALGTLIRP